jgi:1-phosphatidylinositol-4-phosphate 5-kinase
MDSSRGADVAQSSSTSEMVRTSNSIESLNTATSGLAIATSPPSHSQESISRSGTDPHSQESLCLSSSQQHSNTSRQPSDGRGGESKFKRVDLGGVFVSGLTSRWYIIVSSVVVFFLWALITIPIESDGPSLQNTLISGGSLTTVSCLFVIYSYHKVPSFQAHPNRLIYWKSWFDLILGIRFILQPLYESAGSFVNDASDEYDFVTESNKCLVLSVVTQFFLMGSETLYFMLSVDLYFALSNPFTSFKAMRKKYYAFVFLMSLVTAILIGLLYERLPSDDEGDMCMADSDCEFSCTSGTCGAGGKRNAYGLFLTYRDGSLNDLDEEKVEGGFCWVRQNEPSDGTAADGVFSNWNYYIVGLYTIPSTIYICSAIAVLMWALRRMGKGLNQTFDVRKGTIQNCFIYTLVIGGYFIVYNLFYYTWFAIEGSDSAKLWVLKLLAFILSGRGYVNFLVWVQTNDAAKMEDFILGLGPCCCGRYIKTKTWGKDGDDEVSEDVDFNSRVAVNKALQDELKAFVTQGVLEALKRSDARGEAARPRSRKPKFHKWASRLLEDADTLAEPTDDSQVTFELRIPEPEMVDFSKFFGGFFRMWNRCLCRNQEPEVERVAEERFETIQFVDYMPTVFADIRRQFGIQSKEYEAGMKNIAKVSISEGASGAFMMFTKNKKYIIKSCSKEEKLFLTQNAEAFKIHYANHPKTLLCRIYGLHKLTLYGQDFHFIIMENLFLDKKVHFRYDIKGSWVKRSGDQKVPSFL